MGILTITSRKLTATGRIAIKKGGRAQDAQTRLQQPGLRTNYVNYGPVPLLYAYAAWRMTDEWRVESDLDTFPAPGGGGLLDTSARVAWSAS